MAKENLGFYWTQKGKNDPQMLCMGKSYKEVSGRVGRRLRKLADGNEEKQMQVMKVGDLS
jgi:hypothetical protein